MLGCKGGSERPTVDAIALYLMCLQSQVYPHLSLPPHLIGGKVKVLYVLLFLVLVVNFDQFQILLSYTLLLQPPVPMRSCEKLYIPLYIV